MPGVIFGMLTDLKPLIPVRIINPVPNAEGLLRQLNCKALLDTGATDAVLKQSHVEALGLVPSGEMISVHAVGHAYDSPAYTVTIQLVGAK